MSATATEQADILTVLVLVKERWKVVSVRVSLCLCVSPLSYVMFSPPLQAPIHHNKAIFVLQTLLKFSPMSLSSPSHLLSWTVWGQLPLCAVHMQLSVMKWSGT